MEVVITKNPELEEGQMQGILINIEKTCAKLIDLQQRLMRRARGEITRGKRPTKECVTSAVERMLDLESNQGFLREQHGLCQRP